MSLKVRVKKSSGLPMVEVSGVDGRFIGKYTSDSHAPYNSASQEYETPYKIFSFVEETVGKWGKVGKDISFLLNKLDPDINYRSIRVETCGKMKKGFELKIGPFTVKSPNMTEAGWEIEGELYDNIEDAVWRLYVIGISKNKTTNIRDLSKFCDWWVKEINRSFSPMGVKIEFVDRVKRPEMEA